LIGPAIPTERFRALRYNALRGFRDKKLYGASDECAIAGVTRRERMRESGHAKARPYRREIFPRVFTIRRIFRVFSPFIAFRTFSPFAFYGFYNI
jgi:hypothetical protein